MSKANPSSDALSQPKATGSDSIPPVEVEEKHEDSNIIDWDGPQDVADPQNWPDHGKWAHIIMVSLFALVT